MALEWRDIYERLARRPERPDPSAWAALEARVWVWAGDEDVVAETCAEVWRTFNLARGGPSFEGFVLGRLLEVTRTSPPPQLPTPQMEQGDQQRGERGETCLAELGARNPRHHRALLLLYGERATPEEAAEVLAVDAVTVRVLAARARLALAECLARGDRKERPERSKPTPGRSGSRPGRQQKGRPPSGRRPR